MAATGSSLVCSFSDAKPYGSKARVYRFKHIFWALLKLACKDVFEGAAVDEAALDVVVDVGESHGVAPQGLEPAVDGLGGPVA